MSSIKWKYEYPPDPQGRTPLFAKKAWVGRLDGRPWFVVRKVNGKWQSSGPEWHDVSETKAEAVKKCEAKCKS